MNTVELSVHSVGGIAVIKLTGEIGQSELARLSQMLERLEAHRCRKVILDFGKAEHVHYNVVRWLELCAREWKKMRGELKMVHVNGYLKDIFKFCGAHELVEEDLSFGQVFLTLAEPGHGNVLWQ